jgi:putative endopeptidase
MNQRDEYARLRARVDAHAPSRWRVNGPLANLPAFADAFRCRAGAPMRRANACSLW